MARRNAFIAIARRAVWPLPAGFPSLPWHSLQAARVAGSGALVLGRLQHRRESFTGGRSVFRWVATGIAGVVLVASGFGLISRPPAGLAAWRRAIRLEEPSDHLGFASPVPSGPGEMVFSDGTRVLVGNRSQIALEGISPAGAVVRLLRGTLNVWVTPRQEARWMFAAGPFTVEVKGTSFSLDWDPDGMSLRIDMWTGAVLVHGGADGQPVTVGAGQSVVLVGDNPGARWSSPPPGSDPRGAARPSPPPSSLLSSPSPSAWAHPRTDRSASTRRDHRVAARLPAGGDEAPSSAAPAGQSWVTLLARGSFVEIVIQARSRGLDRTLAQGTEVELTAVADAARYTRDTGLARRALLALRDRFPGTPRAVDAAFFLGRLGEGMDGNPASALAWYDRYLRDAPRGAYAEPALVRQMVLLSQDQPGVRAKALASRYLREYRRGTYRDFARSIAQPALDERPGSAPPASH